MIQVEFNHECKVGWIFKKPSMQFTLTNYKKNWFLYIDPGVMDMFIILIVVDVSLVYTYVRMCQIVYFKHVWLLVCQLQLSKT